LLDHTPHVDVDYCQFSDWGYRKPTQVWGSPQIATLDHVVCQSTCPNRGPVTRKHFQQLGGYGPQVSTWLKGRFPEKLTKYLLSCHLGLGPKLFNQPSRFSQWNGTTEWNRMWTPIETPLSKFFTGTQVAADKEGQPIRAPGGRCPP
jgi:hypothetical protein